MSEVIYHSNMQIIQARWPDIASSIECADVTSLKVASRSGEYTTILINNLQMSSRHCPDNEAKVQAATLPSAEILTLYGFGMGHLPEQLLESRPEIKTLRLVVLNMSVLRAIICTRDLSNLLSNNKIQISSADTEIKPLTPYFVSPPDLQLSDLKFVKLRTQLTQEKVNYYNKLRFINGRNEAEIRIDRNADLIKEDGDVGYFFNSAPGRKCCIVGAGPSLDRSLIWCKEFIKKDNPPVIIAVDTALKPLSNIGIRPDIVVSIDMNKRSKFYYEGMEHTPLVYAPILANDVLKAWPGPRYVTYFNLPEYTPWKISHPKKTLVCLSSVIHTATDLALKMGIREIYFMGADFAFPHGKSYAKSLEEFSKPQDHLTEWLLDGYGNKILTQPNMVGYLLDLEELIERNPDTKFFNTSRAGAIINGTTYIKNV